MFLFFLEGPGLQNYTFTGYFYKLCPVIIETVNGRVVFGKNVNNLQVLSFNSEVQAGLSRVRVSDGEIRVGPTQRWNNACRNNNTHQPASYSHV